MFYALHCGILTNICLIPLARYRFCFYFIVIFLHKGRNECIILHQYFLFQMSAGSQIQMAPQSTVNSGQSVHSQDSNMSTGELHVFAVTI